jgi:hypothetical protein
VDEMPRGQRTLSAKDIPDDDLLLWIPTLMAVSLPDTTYSDDAPILKASALAFARVAECAVEQYSELLRQGTVTTFRRRARHLIESTLCENMYLAGQRRCAEALLAEGVMTEQRHIELKESFREYELTAWRTAAGLSAGILNDIEKRATRKSKKGRPRGASTIDSIARLFDSEIAKVAADSCGVRPSKEQIFSAIPNVVRKYLEDGKLRWLGDPGHPQDAVDSHSKRIRASIENLLATHKGGGYSITRRSE